MRLRMGMRLGMATARMAFGSGTRNLHPLSLPSHFAASMHRAATLCSRQISTEAQSVAAQLNSSGFLRTQGLIGGKWIDAYDGKTIQVHNPATGEVIANVPCMGGRETNDAIASAYNAFKSWSKITAAERSKCLRKWYDLIIAHKEELGQIITLEQGKPLKEAIGEVSYGASFIEFFAEEAKRVYGDIIPSTLADRRLFVLKQPVGVVGAITPWNFPLAMITRKVGPALACGCTVVIKPSELTPLTALAAAELSLQAGIPPGAVNVVMGNASDIGDSLLASPQVRKITFTGSTAVGKKLMAGAAGTVKKISLELGGNAPCIIFDDADLDVAIKGALATKFRNSGQTCVCANRIIVQEGIFDTFATAFSNAVQKMQVGDGFHEDVSQGPLINEAAVQKVESFLQDAKSKGAKVLLGGKRHSLGMTFYEPTVITDVKSDMLVSREEVFGPVAPLLRFKTEEEAIHIANDTNAGLAAYVFTTNMQRSWRVSEALEYGIVGVNEGLISTEVAPFGGVKQSGLGREGSKYGMDEFLEIKYVCVGNMNNNCSSLGRGKYSECSTTESSDDIEKQELEEVSDEEEFSYFDTEEYFSEPTNCFRSVIEAVDHMDKCMGPKQQIDDMILNAGKETINSRYPQIVRRKKLPDPVEKEKGVSLWSLIKDNVGKDLTRVCLPVYFNEPISSLQKCFEDLEYCSLLDRAYEHGTAGNSLLRVLNVAAFAASGYASSEGRHCKPFNPLLGETYEADYPEKGIRFFSEKVSHHPTLIACHCEGKGWKFWGDSNLRTKFWGTSIHLDPVGILTLEFDDGEVFQWSKVTTTICNLILGKVYLEHHGTMHIRGNRQYSCRLKFKEQSILDRNPHQVHGFVEDVTGKKVATVFGKWDDSMYYMNGDGTSKLKDFSDASLLWKRCNPPNLTRYNMTPFAITLNELTPGLQEKLPPTDSRLRPDQRHLENGEYEKANAEKLRLERRQRMSRKLQENGWKARWFQSEGEDGPFRYMGGYWEAREQGKWDGCPNIFGEFNEDVNSFKRALI